MPTKLKIATLGFVFVVAYDISTRPLRTKYTEVTRVALELDKENAALKRQLHYLISVINEHEIELDEFDLIVLSHVSETEE